MHKREQKNPGGGRSNIFDHTKIKVKGLRGLFRIWKRPGTNQVRVIPDGYAEDIKNTILVDKARVLNSETGEPFFTPEMERVQRSAPVRNPPIVTLNEEWLRRNVAGFMQGDYYVRAIGDKNCSVYPVAMGATHIVTGKQIGRAHV